MEICNRIFRFLAVARRPLTLDELGEALSVEACQPWFMPERLINDIKGIVRWCHGLIALHDLDDTLQFAHSSVKDFLCSPGTERTILGGFHFRQDEAERELGEICVTYVNFNDFKTQLVRLPKSQAFLDLDPMMVASHTLSSKSSSLVLDKAKELMRTRSKSTSATSRLLLPQAIGRANHAVTQNYTFLQYASEFWPSHTTDFTPDQGTIWSLFQKSAEQRYSVLSETNNSGSSWYSDPRSIDLREFALSHQHRALFRQWIARVWHEDDLPLTLSSIVCSGCLSFVKLLPPPTEKSKFSWLEAIQTLKSEPLSRVLDSLGIDWMRGLTPGDRSIVLAKVIDFDRNSSASWALVQLGIDPYHEWKDSGSATTLIEKLISYRHNRLLSRICGNMVACHVDFARRIVHSGKTALHVAAYSLNPAATAILLERGAIVDATDDHGQTALHVAVTEGSQSEGGIHVASVLLEAGASLELKDEAGKVALDYANDIAAKRILDFIENGCRGSMRTYKDRYFGY